MSDPADTQTAMVRLWARTTADLIDVAQAFWNGLINLNPAERDTMSAACEGSTVVGPRAIATALGHSDFIDAHGNVLPNALVELVPDRIEAGNRPTEVCVRVAPDGVHSGRYTAVLLDDSGAPIGSRFSVYMAG